MRNVIEALLCIIDIVHDTACSHFHLQQILRFSRPDFEAFYIMEAIWKHKKMYGSGITKQNDLVKCIL